jgi:hypothetical protein
MVYGYIRDIKGEYGYYGETGGAFNNGYGGTGNTSGVFYPASPRTLGVAGGNGNSYTLGLSVARTVKTGSDIAPKNLSTRLWRRVS